MWARVYKPVSMPWPPLTSEPSRSARVEGEGESRNTSPLGVITANNHWLQIFVIQYLLARNTPPLLALSICGRRCTASYTGAVTIGGDGDIGYANSAIVALQGGFEKPGGESSAAVPARRRVLLRVACPGGGPYSRVQ